MQHWLSCTYTRLAIPPPLFNNCLYVHTENGERFQHISLTSRHLSSQDNFFTPAISLSWSHSRLSTIGRRTAGSVSGLFDVWLHDRQRSARGDRSTSRTWRACAPYWICVRPLQFWFHTHSHLYQELLQKCHPLGSFDSMASIAVANNMRYVCCAASVRKLRLTAVTGSFTEWSSWTPPLLHTSASAQIKRISMN